MSDPSVGSARRIAFDVVSAVRTSDAYANLLLPARLRRAGTTAQEAAFATELTYGTLRMRGLYDAIVAEAAGRPIRKVDNDVADLLRLGCHQLLAMSVAPHAAVNETVSLAGRVTKGRASGFVNAVLRSVERRSRAEWVEVVAARTRSRMQRLAVVHSHPRWVVSALRDSLEADGRAGELEALLEADNVPAGVTVAAYDGEASLGADLEAGRYSPYAYRLAGGDPRRVLTDAGGAVRVQDEGSQLAALTLTRARPVRAGEQWLDLCAGPGGKTALLAAEAARTGASLTANEVIPSRAGLVREAVAAASITVPVWERDGREIGASHAERFDRILVDAPCSGLGALRRRPESRWRRSARDVEDLVSLQAELLDSAVRALRPGGVLCYVTCSPHVSETREAVNSVLARHDGRLVRLSAAETVGAAARRMPPGLSGPDVQLWPHAHETDAMFVALLSKR